ncbi:hypothetical protein ONZ45_g15889 [Pleurotus djamor]|nr:hypothetical protein ONZ45_g15889 [Pleurotus djamor]
MPLSRLRRISSAVTLWLLCSVLATSAYEVPVTDKDYLRQTCSGMWGGDSAYINVTFDSTSQGQLAMVVYEWTDSDYLGKVTNPEEILPQKTFVCTTPALMGGFCDRSQLGRFIVDLPEGKSVNETSFWSARVDLSSDHAGNGTASAFWDNPDGNPDVPPSNYTSPFRTRELSLRQENHSPEGTYQYKGPIQYFVRKTGYYCVAIVPFTLQNDESPETSDTHAAFKGQIFFHNTFEGKLPATDYPKVNFYFVMFLLYAIFAAAWGWMCYRHMNDLLPIQVCVLPFRTV